MKDTASVDPDDILLILKVLIMGKLQTFPVISEVSYLFQFHTSPQFPIQLSWFQHIWLVSSLFYSELCVPVLVSQ